MAADPAAVSERNPERDTDTGQFDDHYPDEQFLDAVRDGDLPTTGDVAAVVGCDRRTAYVRLNALADDGVVSSKKVAGALVWERIDDSDP